MRGGRDRALAWALAAHFACGIDGALGEERQQAAFACGGEVLTRGRVVAVTDGRTLTFDHGRGGRLAAIEVPPLPEPAGGAPPGGRVARDALAALVADAEVALVRAEGAPA